MKILHFTAKWCPFCPASERAFQLFREKHPKLQTELIDVDQQPDVAQRYHVDGVPAEVIIGGARPIHGACYSLDEFEAFWRNATEKPEKKMPAKKMVKKAAKKTVKKVAARRPAKKTAPKAARKAVRTAKKPAKKARK